MKRALILALMVLLLSACLPAHATPTPTVERPAATPARLLIGEVMPAGAEDSRQEYIELYNAGTEAADLSGWQLLYRLTDDQEPQVLYAWETGEVPGHGHYLLQLEGSDFGLTPDAFYATPLFERKGGLLLVDAQGEVVDRLGWGDAAPASATEGRSAPAPAAGQALERLPGGEAGNGRDSDDNAADFRLNADFVPQNSGSPLTPAPEANFALSVALPSTVEPGGMLTCTVALTNATGLPQEDVRLVLPLPADYEPVSIPPQATVEGTLLLWPVGTMEAGETVEGEIALRAPWTYKADLVGGFHVEAAGWPLRAYAAPHRITIEGGSVPIAVARTLVGKEVTVEGVATMYTGGFYAGSSGTKFYVEDETGGVQVYCPGGAGKVEVAVGQRVRVHGKVDLYRNAVEVIPNTYPDDVEIVDSTPITPTPTPVAIADVDGNEMWLGRYIAITGTLTSLTEGNYDYRAELTDAEGRSLLIVVEKQTGVDVEPLEVGKMYRVSGICELYVNTWELKPRLQSDFEPLYPPELMLEMTAQNSVRPGGLITYTLSAVNHTHEVLHNVALAASLPTEGVASVEVLDGGRVEGGEAVWTIAELPPEGGSATVRFVAQVSAEARDRIVSEGAIATADEWPQPVAVPAWTTYVGNGVPINAIQGPGMASPYVRTWASTEGVVTAIFPDLGGFWIQSLAPDDDPATSEGLFVLMEEVPITVSVGDEVIVSGKIRERSEQTLIDPQSPADLEVVRHGLPLPTPVPFDPPRDEAAAQLYDEAREGMLVQLGEAARVVGPTTKYGETALVAETHGLDLVRRGEPTGEIVFLDDGSFAAYTTREELPYFAEVGDLVLAASGPLAFTYGHYKIEPTEPPRIVHEDRPLPQLEGAGTNEISLATFNAENFFDFKPPNPSSPPMPTVREYHRKLKKVADAIVRMGAPTILGLEEIENLDVLEDLAAEPALADYDYHPVLIEGTDSRGIDVGFLVRGDVAEIEGASAHPAPGGLTSRPPLLITVTVHLDEGDERLYAIVNHFTSMGGGVEATEPRRVAQAAWNLELVERLQAAHPDAMIAVMGDLNAYYDAPTLDTLREGGLLHVYEAVEGDRPFTYIYQGEAETLDHILVTPPLFEHLVRVEALHIDAPFTLPPEEDETARRTSDHDPLVAIFRFGE